MIHKTTLAALIGVLTLGIAACEKEGKAERVGEEVDEAVGTMQNGGEETVGTKVDDALDDAREEVKDSN